MRAIAFPLIGGAIQDVDVDGGGRAAFLCCSQYVQIGFVDLSYHLRKPARVKAKNSGRDPDAHLVRHARLRIHRYLDSHPTGISHGAGPARTLIP